MPRFARLFEAAADTLNAFYQTVADSSIDALMALWIDEEFASYVNAGGAIQVRQRSAGDAARSRLGASRAPV